MFEKTCHSVVIHRIVLLVRIDARQYRIDILRLTTGLGKQSVERFTHLGRRRTIHQLCTVDSAECMKIFLVAEQHAGGCFSGKTLSGFEVPPPETVEKAIIMLRQFIVSTDERRPDFSSSELQESIEQRLIERRAAMYIRIVVPVTFQIDGNCCAQDVVRRLHEEGGLEKLLVVFHDGKEKLLRVRDTSEACAADDGIGLFDARVLKR